MMKNNMLKKKFVRCKSAFRRFTYPSLPNFLLEPTVSVTTTTQPSTNGVTTSSQEGVIPIATLFSSSDLGQPSTTTTKPRPATSGGPLRRAISFYQIEQDKEQSAA
jgi:hypothetical protein